jgi:hypothetical protein
MHLIEVTPGPCLVCGQGNTPTPHGDRRQFVDLEVDTHWDDPAIICEDCGLKIGGMLGMLSPEVRHQLMLQVKEAEQATHDSKAETDAMLRRARRLGIEFVPEEQVA